MVPSRIYRDEIFLALDKAMQGKDGKYPLWIETPLFRQIPLRAGIHGRGMSQVPSLTDGHLQMHAQQPMPPSKHKSQGECTCPGYQPSSQDKKQERRKILWVFLFVLFVCLFLFVIGDSQQNFVQNDSPMVRTMNSPVCEADSNNKLFRFYPMPMILPLMTKDSDRGKLWLPKNGSITNSQSHIQPKQFTEMFSPVHLNLENRYFYYHFQVNSTD